MTALTPRPAPVLPAPVSTATFAWCQGRPGAPDRTTIERGYTWRSCSASASAYVGRLTRSFPVSVAAPPRAVTETNHTSRWSCPARTARAGTPSRSAPVPAARPSPFGTGRSARAHIATSRSGLDRFGLRCYPGVLDQRPNGLTSIVQSRASRLGITSPSGGAHSSPASPLGALVHLPGADPGTHPPGL